ncbi:efflux RND transporter periplasmic adaptor subunit [Neobacillus massiliamazoniensis]|uniref:Biotin/lipoyl attachment domain-containing protein n=1 Tax=Neobacillus massiliamazoniensis TaxID=1499688 RepID=A0A0U1NTI0_9BACI|nr:efflux RND transporter periplasmic adaptor subunit [Neobacillus massiliamazoniensis]CRK81048.1 biotin/lipoyl attachment domain-containing protein [Neobacillus massiliamazoniensis]
MKKWIIIIIAVLVVGGGGYLFYSSKTKAQQQTPTQNRTAVVQKGKFEVRVSGSGTVQPVTTEDIKSTINNNQIAEVLVSAGQAVKAGDVLITFTDGSNPITAPSDGVVTAINVQAGERVQIGQAVAHLTNYNDLQTVASIDELDIPKVSVGQTATIKINALPDQTFNGTVTAIANEGTSTNGVSTFDVTVHIDNPTGLKVGMSTEADILTASKDNALYVPVDAVHSMNGKKFVMLANQDQNSQNTQGNNQNSQGNQWSSSRVMVQTGMANADYVEITQGLTEGQVVRLPNLVISSNNNAKYMQGGFGGMGGYGGMGGMGRQNRGGGNGGNGGGKASSGGRGGN